MKLARRGSAGGQAASLIMVITRCKLWRAWSAKGRRREKVCGGNRATGNSWTVADVWGQVDYRAALLLVLLLPRLGSPGHSAASLTSGAPRMKEWGIARSCWHVAQYQVI